ncbi:MAG: 3-isopropylmalate dehydratase small subunit [Polyangiaceae bacterium]|jgi:3-isopropylmalate/(R)-2-methylmalate dehydratase small subunit
MPLEKISRVAGRGIHLPGEDVDTDRIVPARFMRCVTFDDLGRHAFEDARAEATARGALHPFDDPRFEGATVLVVGRNFGCGSSREHAARAIAKRGIRAIVGESFGEIFSANATGLGIPCASVSPSNRDAIARLVEAESAALIDVDLVACRVQAGDALVPFEMPGATRRALLEGAWDPIADLLARDAAIRATSERLDYLRWPRVGA